MGKAVTVSVMGVPPYITFNAETKVLGGIDVAFFKIIAEKFRLKVTMKPEKTWSSFYQLNLLRLLQKARPFHKLGK